MKNKFLMITFAFQLRRSVLPANTILYQKINDTTYKESESSNFKMHRKKKTVQIQAKRENEVSCVVENNGVGDIEWIEKEDLQD